MTQSPDKFMNQLKSCEKQSRGERKTLKALEIFCFKKIDRIKKVKIGKKKQVWIINSPEIYQSQNYGSFLIFGEAKVGKGSFN